MKTKLIFSMVLTTVLAWGSLADAYTTNGRWSGTTVTMRASSVSFSTTGTYRASLGTVVRNFNRNPSNFRFNQTYDDTSVSLGNNQNEVWFSSDAANNPAVTYTWHNSSGRIVEADVVFYTGVSWTTSMNKTSVSAYGGTRRPFQTTAMHEYGHVAGLGHEADEYNIMGADYTHLHCNGSTVYSYVGEDAADGLIALYGSNSNSNIQDVSVTLFKRISYNGEYSTHGKCQMFDTYGRELSYTNYQGQRRYQVKRGQQVRVQFTYENNGESYQSQRTGFYISRDSYISTGDSRFASVQFGMNRNDPYTIYHTITIPSNLSSGITYYLGVIVDYPNAIGENDEMNAAYHIIRVN